MFPGSCAALTASLVRIRGDTFGPPPCLVDLNVRTPGPFGGVAAGEGTLVGAAAEAQAPGGGWACGFGGNQQSDPVSRSGSYFISVLCFALTHPQEASTNDTPLCESEKNQLLRLEWLSFYKGSQKDIKHFPVSMRTLALPVDSVALKAELTCNGCGLLLRA